MALTGKIAVVTGAAMGIGKAITELLVLQRCQADFVSPVQVILLDLDETAANHFMGTLNEQYGEDRTLFLSCDVSSDEQMKAAFQKAVDTFGGIDIVCNVAGIADELDWEKTLSINLGGVVRGTYAALKHMNKKIGGWGGVIINAGAIGSFFPLEVCPVYTAAAHGIIGFTRSMAVASYKSGYGVRINAIRPGVVQTRMLTIYKSRMGQFGQLEGSAGQYMEKAGMLTPPEVAECVLDLVTDEAKNGEALMVFEKEKKYITFPEW